jgi:hypothetical protein
MTDRKKPGMAFWATGVLVAVLVAYPLSSGPFVRFHYKLGRPDWMQSIGDVLYAPLIWTIQRGPQSVAVRFLEYQKWWVDPSDLGLPDLEPPD